MSQTKLGLWHNWPYDQSIVGSYDTELDARASDAYITHNNPRKGRIYVDGKYFLSQRHGSVFTPSDSVSVKANGKPYYSGSFIADAPNPQAYDLMVNLDDYGPEAYRRMAPDKPLAELGTALYELRELPGMVKDLSEIPAQLKERYHQSGLHRIANWHLALQFGWLPLLSDTRSVFNGLKRFEQRVQQLIRDNGRPIRRKLTIYEHSEDEDLGEGRSQFPAAFPTLVTQGYVGDTHWTLKRRFRERVWASARFRYELPDASGMSNFAYRSLLMARLMGLKPTPARIYQVIPWSWLVDWFGNIGDNLANIDASVADTLSADYFYLMRHAEHVNIHTTNFRVRTGSDSSQPVSASTSSGMTRKERVIGSRFGLAFKSEAPSLLQTSILAAIGSKKIR